MHGSLMLVEPLLSKVSGGNSKRMVAQTHSTPLHLSDPEGGLRDGVSLWWLRFHSQPGRRARPHTPISSLLHPRPLRRPDRGSTGRPPFPTSPGGLPCPRPSLRRLVGAGPRSLLCPVPRQSCGMRFQRATQSSVLRPEPPWNPRPTCSSKEIFLIFP